ncbi:MAG: UDP-N-acetylmuramoyl-L-alanine--D-glutamate ligase [Acidobacteria bacterium]|nr:MAG: UDP-N-acetylmuramoyl-L-alanine--D-glutamate ligase [Acidobacteriota bacterium]
MNFENKRAAVLGLGSSGEAAGRLLHAHGAQVTIFDSGTPPPVRVQTLRQLGVSVVLGPSANSARADYDFNILSPGIDPSFPIVQNFLRQGASLIGELELGFRFCSRPIVAITGTNGKTTTTQLVEEMLNTGGIRALACGNIGTPFAEAVQRQEEFDLFVVEVSSFQLETIATFRPDVAVWLNLTPDHLDRYGDMGEYRAAKFRIFENQGATDYAVINHNDELPALVPRQIRFSAFRSDADFTLGGNVIFFRGKPVLDTAETHLRGVHNIENLMAALGVAYALNLNWDKATPALKRYQALPHRCEEVGEIEGVKFINDSKATNLDALAKALESQPRPVILVAGGKDKGFDFDTLSKVVRGKVKHAILIGEMAHRISESWSTVVPCSIAKTLREAVWEARRQSQEGDVVLFSPGTSSFDMFKNYADRGNQFRQIIQELTR